MDPMSEDFIFNMMEPTETDKTFEGDPKNSKSPNKDNLDSDKDPEVWKRISELTDEDIRGLEFDTEEDAYDFYREYAKFIGFSVRKGDVYRNCNGTITMRQLVCNREGERSEKHLNRTDRIREAKALTRTECKARLRVSLDYRSRKWRVGIFELAHNHELTPASMIHLLPAYRGLSVADKAQVDGLHHYGVRTCHIMGLIMGQKGGYSDLGFCKKDLYNHIDKENRAKIEDGDAFAALCYLQSNRQKFKDEWNNVVDKHGVRENRTTSICEGINSFIKRYVQSKNSLVDFLHNFERAVNEYRHNELTSDFKSKYTQPVMTTALERYEVQASNVYTRNKFFDVRKQIEKVSAINVIERTDVGNVITMQMNKFGTPDSSYIVTLDKSDGNFVCDCRMFESCGLPCSHIFSAMKHEQVESIPSSLILKRWTKLAKVQHISSVYAEEGDTSKKDLLRSGAVGAACNRLNKAARRNPHNFVKNIESIHKLAEQMERREGIDLDVADISRAVRDPTVVKTKGAPRKNKKMTKKRKCSYCKCPGHTVRTCTKYATRDQLDTVIEEESSVETDEDSRDESRSRDVHISNHLNDVTVSAGQNCASDKGQSKKRRRNSEGLKMTQESVNERRSSDVNKCQQNDTGVAFSRINTPSLFGNHVYYSNMNGPSISRPVHIRPSMIHGFGQGFVGNIVEDMLQYPQMYMQQSMYTPPVVHNFDQYGNSFQFPNSMNNVERNNGARSKGFGKK
ncbi:Zinc finger, PMZ-type [Sesbania bispinosa]|nr:Zinc finger, PMZ-type [Sesbania bispinosa]